MEEFIRANYRLFALGVEFIAAVIGIFCYAKYKHTVAKYFIYFLITLAVCDFIGGYNRYVQNEFFLSFLKDTIFEKNYWWSTIYWKIGAIMFFGFYYYKILNTRRYKISIKYSSYLFFLFSVGYILFNIDDFFVRFFPILSVLGAGIIFLCTTLYFVELLRSDRILSFYKSLNFYISVAIFIWWLIITPIVFYDMYMSNLDWNFIVLRWQIYLFANLLMYSTFTFALIFCEPEDRSRNLI